ncbi:Transmembrane and coiled-coil domain-containing protein 4 [Phytophthora cinnamomi]|uniref:Transmembrane and coiled-coil domain-containing protein 4 n=1 Tax=Phytophthora cinnamomi TaxID=4785 RepID=UPI00355A06A4|nr:Transmembrane and coiled-coil domain-containing protein 4 [Phytophthora cinnamomi]
MSAAVGFGEYDALLPCDGVNAALAFSRELFSREYVVQRVTREALAVAVKQKEKLWRGLARINSGHVVVSVDGVAARGLSSRQFAELWYPPPGPEASDAADQGQEMLSRYRRVRFRDRKRAELEVEMQKDWVGSGPMRFTPVQDEAALRSKIKEVHALIWDHELSKAHAVLRSLPVGSDPMVCLLAAELEAVRVLVSKDDLG